MRKKKAAANKKIISLDCDEEYYNGFSEDDVAIGDVVKSFNFFVDSASETKEEVCDNPNASEKLIDNRTLQKQPYGITPPVDGERFEVKRTFMFRRSTVRMLNKLKAEHEDENVYLSSILDEAIRRYFEFVCSKSK
ncbi:MAG: hypothetical protein K0S75_1456 [Clostridia bacterium]|jgi:hypothetical protein|nr:hypothetical protein [Clostridia bacterium]